MFRPSSMALRLSFSASSRRTFKVKRSLTCPGTGEGFARRATASLAATSRARTPDGLRFGEAARGSSGCALLGADRALRRLFTAAKRRDRTGPRRLRAFRLSKSFRLSHERDEVYPLALVGHGDELVPVPTPLYGRGDPVERPADESQSLIAVPSDWILAAAARTGTGPSLGTLAVLVEPDRRHGSAIIAADAIGMLSRLCGRVPPLPTW